MGLDETPSAGEEFIDCEFSTPKHDVEGAFPREVPHEGFYCRLAWCDTWNPTVAVLTDHWGNYQVNCMNCGYTQALHLAREGRTALGLVRYPTILADLQNLSDFDEIKAAILSEMEANGVFGAERNFFAIQFSEFRQEYDLGLQTWEAFAASWVSIIPPTAVKN